VAVEKRGPPPPPQREAHTMPQTTLFFSKISFLVACSKTGLRLERDYENVPVSNNFRITFFM